MSLSKHNLAFREGKTAILAFFTCKKSEIDKGVSYKKFSNIM